jgi:hypothetical protein
MPHVPPLRVDVAILLLLFFAAALMLVIFRTRRQRRRPPSGIRVDLVGREAGPTKSPPGH